MREIYKLLMIIALILIAIIGFFGLTGCSSQAKLNRAKQRVLINADARHEIFLNELERFPCANDSVVQIIKTGIDSISLEEYFLKKNIKLNSSHGCNNPYCLVGTGFVRKTNITTKEYLDPNEWDIGINKQIDSTYKKKELENYSNSAFYEKGYQEAINQYSIIKIPVCKPEYIKVTVTDKQKEKILTDSLRARNLTAARLFGESAIKDQVMQDLRADNQKKEAKWLWWLIVSIVFGIVSNLGWIYFKFKP